jgi:hypothetical protein
METHSNSRRIFCITLIIVGFSAPTEHGWLLSKSIDHDFDGKMRRVARRM